MTTTTEQRITVYQIPLAAVRHILAFDRQRPIAAPCHMPPGLYVEDPRASASLPEGVIRLVALADPSYALAVHESDVGQHAIDYVPDGDGFD